MDLAIADRPSTVEVADLSEKAELQITAARCINGPLGARANLHSHGLRKDQSTACRPATFGEP